ncbi:hypothetical protein CDAR_487461 [Caerostris darwini]|uniref:C2H2-type domain-containing protein n=1 Tax=Caerostris darwini TaxID=1538125 RepID=A0AAV4TT82_9ARAC|nr:hypothetical protein CDAR_487461 [Caerostris darwini]
MERTKCEYCNTYVTKFEVHNCMKFGNQHCHNYATISQNSYGNLAEDINLSTAEQMYYEARNSPMNQMNFSRQQSILSNVNQPIYCKETAATEKVSQYGVANQYGYNPETSDFLFFDMHPFQENEPNSTQLQLLSEQSKVFINQNFQSSNSAHPPNISWPIDEPIFLTGFQETSDQSNATIIPTAQPSHASTQMQSSEISRTSEMSSHFSSACFNFSGSDRTLINRLSQYSETSVEIPNLAIQNSQYNPSNQIPQTNYIHRTDSFPFATLSCDINSKNRSTSGNSLCRNRENSIFNLYGTENPSYLTDHVSLPADSVSYASSPIQTQQRNFGSGIINSSSETRAWGYSTPLTYSSDTCNACNLSTITTAKESTVDCNEHSPDKMLNKNSSVFKQNLDTNVGKPSKILYTCSKCSKHFCRKEYLESHERHHDVERPYVCHYCDRAFTQSSNMRQHIRTHTGEKLYECMHCGKCFTQISARSRHVRFSHTGDKTDP